MMAVAAPVQWAGAGRPAIVNALVDRIRPATAQPIALLVADLQGLSGIAQTFGSDIADELVQRIIDQLHQVLPTDTACFRLSDTRLALICRIMPSKTAISRLAGLVRAAAYDVADAPALAAPPPVGAAVMSSGAMLTRSDAAELVRRATVAAESAARPPVQRLVMWSTAVDARIRDATLLTQSLRRALAQQEFALHFQPIIDLRTGAIGSLEALLRWDSIDGAGGPAAFIPAAEESGLIIPIGTAVVQQAMRQARRWLAAGIDCPPIAVNISGLQLGHPGFLSVIERATNGSGVPPSRLVIELTERCFIDGGPATIRILAKLRAMGVGIAIDDFGTGYSALQYLRDLPVTSLKVDRAFVSRITEQPRDAALLGAILGVATALRLEAVAEGVETEAQRRWLIDNDCGFAQGYLFSRPLPATAVAKLLRQRQLEPA